MRLQNEILESLDIPGWDDSIAAVKRVVGNALQRLDRSANIEDTKYFNHSFVPDFVLKWPREPGRVRDVFLRLDSSRAFIAGDLKYLGDEKPVFLGLTGLEEMENKDKDYSSSSGSFDTSAMVTEPDAVEELGTDAGVSVDFGQVLPAAMLKGGKGIVREQTAIELTAAAAGFFAGSREHVSEKVLEAVPNFREYLDPPQAARVLNFGRIVWEATGGDPLLFPVSTDLAGLDDAGLRFLLEEAPSDDMLFWRSVGRLVSLERLLSLGVREAPNLVSFVRANGDRLYARTLLVKALQRRLDDSGPSWLLDAGGLALRGADFIAYIAPRRDDLTVQADSARGLNFDTFRRRINTEQVDTVTIVAGDRKTVTIMSQDILDPATDVVLASVGDLPGTAIEAVGLIVSGKHLECDFVARVASGHTNAVFDAISLLEHGLPTLWPVTDDRDVVEIRRLGQTVSGVALQRSLFDQANRPPEL